MLTFHGSEGSGWVVNFHEMWKIDISWEIESTIFVCADAEVVVGVRSQ